MANQDENIITEEEIARLDKKAGDAWMILEEALRRVAELQMELGEISTPLIERYLTPPRRNEDPLYWKVRTAIEALDETRRTIRYILRRR